MTPRWYAAPVAAGVLLIGSLLSACTGEDPGNDAGEAPSSASASPTPTPAVAPDQPEEGRCYDLDYEESLAPTVEAEAVSCGEPHTAQTFLVGGLDTVVDGHLVAVDSDQARAQISRTCPAQLSDWIGGTREQARLSMIRAVWFSPTLEASDAGHNWFRCDAVVISGQESLEPIRGSLRGVLDSERGRLRYGMCSEGKPGTKSFGRVLCSSEHGWRAIATTTITPGKDGAWPGEQAARRSGESRCKSLARERAEDKLTFSWGYEWPSKEQWAAGIEHGTCWIPD